MIEERYTRTAMVLGEDALRRLGDAHVAVFGLGGVGSYVTEALARAGVGRLSLIDSDTVAPSNLNRQLCALESTLGLPKTDVLKARCLDIRSDLDVRTFRQFILPENLSAFMETLGPLDFVVDAIDTVSAKIALAVYCEAHAVPLISCCGTGNKLHPELFMLADIYDTSVCPLCKVLRRELKARGVKKLTVCYSKEAPAKTGSRTPGSVSFVPGAAGLIIAGHVVRSLCGVT